MVALASSCAFFLSQSSLVLIPCFGIVKGSEVAFEVFGFAFTFAKVCLLPFGNGFILGVASLVSFTFTGLTILGAGATAKGLFFALNLARLIWLFCSAILPFKLCLYFILDSLPDSLEL